MKNIALLKENAKDAMALLEFEEEAREFLAASLDRVLGNEETLRDFSRLLDAYDESCETDLRAAVAEMRILSEKAGIPTLTGSLLLYLCMLPRLRRYYEEKGIDDAIFLATVQDLSYKLTESKMVEGVYGISDGSADGWYPNMFKCKTLAFVRLHFVFERAGFECEVDGVKIEKDTPVHPTET